MIRLFIFSLLAIVLALWVTLYLGFPADPGYLLIAFGNYTFETSLFALLVAAIFLYTAFRLFLILFDWINPLHLLAAGRELNLQRKAKARSNSVEGLLCLARGNWQSSLKFLKKGMSDKDATSINYLAAAYAAFQLGQRDTWIELLEEAEQRFPTARSTINYVKAQLHYQSGQLEQSLAVLEELKKNALNDGNLLSLLKEVYVQLDDWQHLEELLPSLEKNKILDAEDLARVQKRIFMEKLYDSFNNAREGNTDSLDELKKLWKKAPAEFHEDEKVVTHYADLLMQLQEDQDAAKVLETALSRTWNSKLVRLYGAKEYGTSAQQLLVAENWLKTNPADSELLLSLGRICMRNQLWGKAREYYEASIKIAPSAEAYGELGRLLKHLGEIEASETYLKSYGDLMGAQLPELPMPKPDQTTH
ncbi:MAG: hypothetical protein MI746_07870 [Pseudomonadales bacterium]|nr:hypothetical protein [Pseudomonadales bacterium]